jgi:hypothetical protein
VTSALVRLAGACPDAIDLLPCLGQDAGRLGEDAELAELGGDLHGEVAFQRDQLRAVAVPALDTALGVAPVTAHVPLAARAAGTGLGIGTPDDAGNEIARLDTAAWRRLAHPAEQLVPQNESIAARGRLAVLARHDLAVGTAHAERGLEGTSADR